VAAPGLGVGLDSILIGRDERSAVAAALCRSVLLGRAVATATAVAVGLLLVGSPPRMVVLVAALVATTALQLAVISRWPRVVGAPIRMLLVDSALLLVFLALSRGTLGYFCYATGSAALAGVLLGMRALPLWVAQAAQGFAVGAAVLRGSHTRPDIAAFVLAFPMVGILAGLGATVATGVLVRHLAVSVDMMRAVRRSAAASERSRLARELHDSVTKTLRAISLAALALPMSLRRQPALAERLAGIISNGLEAADREARELIAGLRLDPPDEDFARVLTGVCQAWARVTGILVRTSIAPVDPPVAWRYELVRILHEALANVERHANAGRVSVVLVADGPALNLVVRDDGVGFDASGPLADLQHAGHVGLVGMRERATAIGGILTVSSGPGQGTTISVRVPWRTGAGTGPAVQAVPR
jgi:signal transduction histidine kinase